MTYREEVIGDARLIGFEVEEIVAPGIVIQTTGTVSLEYARRFVAFFRKRGASILRIVRVSSDGQREVIA